MGRKPKDEQPSLGDAQEKEPKPSVAGIDWSIMRQETPREATFWLPKKIDAQHGAALLFRYVKAEYVMDVLERACGYGGWSFEIAQVSQGQDGWVVGRLTLYAEEGRVLRYENVGYPGRVSYDKASKEVIAKDDEPLKSAATDGLKRCAVLAGVARDLREESGGIWVKANIITKDGKPYLDPRGPYQEDPYDVWERQRNGQVAAPEKAGGQGPSVSDLVALARKKFGQGSLNKLRKWLSEQTGGQVSDERQIAPGNLADTYTTLKDWTGDPDAS